MKCTLRRAGVTASIDVIPSNEFFLVDVSRVEDKSAGRTAGREDRLLRRRRPLT